MAIDTQSLTQIITDFRALQSKDAVSPESLGYILQRIADLLATAGTSARRSPLPKSRNCLNCAGASAEDTVSERRRLAVPILDGMKVWMEAAYAGCTPKEPLAKAIQYALSLWPRVVRSTEDGDYLIDSNPVEQGQRPSVLGRKNYLFSQNDHGAEDNAIFNSFLAICDILKVNPYQWLTDKLERLRPGMDDEQLVELLPCCPATTKPTRNKSSQLFPDGYVQNHPAKANSFRTGIFNLTGTGMKCGAESMHIDSAPYLGLSRMNSSMMSLLSTCG